MKNNNQNIGEFALIEQIKEQFATISAPGCEGIGDDCAVIPWGTDESMVITTDLLVEGVHFLREAISPYLLGRKSLAVNLSDVAAMGATPFASFLSLSLPHDATGEWAQEFIRGYHTRSQEFAIPLLGGDTTSAQKGVTISVTALGRVSNAHIKRRSEAKCGDKILVTGKLGDSSKGLLDLLAGNFDSPYLTTHHNPKPYIREGEWLGCQIDVHAMMDLSDGLASDLVHILTASQKGAEVILENIPTNTTVEMAVTGGEDYKLLFTVSAAAVSDLQHAYHAQFGELLHEIGTIVSGPPYITWLDAGKIVTPQWHGFTHF